MNDNQHNKQRTEEISEDALRFMERAHSPATLRAYRSDFAHFKAWCDLNGCESLPPTEQTVGNYLAAHAENLLVSTLTRRLSAIQHYCCEAGVRLNMWNPAIRNVLRGIRAIKGNVHTHCAALTPSDISALVTAAGDSLAGKRDRALILVGFAGAFRRSELVAIDIEHLSETDGGVAIFVPRSKGDQKGRGAIVEISYGYHTETCPVLALRDWIAVSGLTSGPVFRKVDQWGNLSPNRLHGDTVRSIIQRLGKAANIVVPEGERLSAHGLRAGCVTEAYRSGAGDEEIAAHTRHATLAGMRGYVRKNRLTKLEMSKIIGL